MTDSKYFTTTKKGEIFELKSELNNDKKEKKKEAVKKVRCFAPIISRPPNNIDLFYRWLQAWRLAKMCRPYFRMSSIVCKPIIWNWKNWSICIWWIMPSLNRTWQSWPLTLLLRLVFFFGKLVNLYTWLQYFEFYIKFPQWVFFFLFSTLVNPKHNNIKKNVCIIRNSNF